MGKKLYILFFATLIFSVPISIYASNIDFQEDFESYSIPGDSIYEQAEAGKYMDVSEWAQNVFPDNYSGSQQAKLDATAVNRGALIVTPGHQQAGEVTLSYELTYNSVPVYSDNSDIFDFGIYNNIGERVTDLAVLYDGTNENWEFVYGGSSRITTDVVINPGEKYTITFINDIDSEEGSITITSVSTNYNSGTISWGAYHPYSNSNASVNAVMFTSPYTEYDTTELYLDNLSILGVGDLGGGVPEPSTIILFLFGITGLIFKLKRKK